MALTRRQFIGRTGLAVAGSFLGPRWGRNALVRRALADTLGDRYFVVVFLDGGNDGLNTVTPIVNGSTGALRTHYETARKTGAGGLRLLASELSATAIGSDPNTGTPLALHPGLAGLKRLYDQGAVAVVQGCGYPAYSLSHEVSRRTWQSGRGSPGIGWVGRYLAANYGGTDIPAMTVANDIAGEFAQTTTSVLAVRRLRALRFPLDGYNNADDAAKLTAFRTLSALATVGAQPLLRYLGDAGTATLDATQSYPALHAEYERNRATFSDTYDALDTGCARDLREVAKVIFGVERGVPDVHARFFEVRNGGYDTHSDQGAGDPNGRHYTLHAEVGDALEVFYQDCVDMGVADKLCVLVWSEFARRVEQNDNGSDHGSQGPVIVVGGAVNGGVFGHHPNIDPAALNDDGNTPYSQASGDPFRSTDFRDVYGTILKHWLNTPASTILSSILAPDSGDAGTYWTAPNFDMGFL